MTKITFEDLPSTNTPINATNLNTIQNNAETAIENGDSTTVTTVENWVKSIVGLGSTTRLYTNTNINTIETSGFAYLNACNYGGTVLDNGYLLTIVYTNNYILQIFMYVNSGGIRYRRKVNGTWSDWKEEYSEYINIQEYYKNSWISNGISTAHIDGSGYKIIQISCQSGTSQTLMTLPTDLRPSGSVILPAINIATGATGYILITTDGTVSTGLTVTTGTRIVCSGGYY